MVGCFPCDGHGNTASSYLKQCYPPSKQLVSAGSDYKPLNQDLSKLVEFANSKPGQLAKIGEELETRVGKEARGSSGGYAKSRASLLVSLFILKALTTECKQHLSHFSRPALRIIVTALDVKVYQRGGADLEVVGRAASCFTAFASYTEGGPIGADATQSKDYLAALANFGRMAVEQGSSEASEKPDMESQNRTRMIGLACLSSASGSDALFLSESGVARQIDIIIPALLSNLFDSSLDDIKAEAAKIHLDTSPSPFFTEFSVRRPFTDRRATSLRGYKAGEKGPQTSDVLSAALRALKALMGQCEAPQVTKVLDAVFAHLDRRNWTDVERCCWLTEELAKFTVLQYRSGIPARIVGSLSSIPDGPPIAKQSTLLAMLCSLLNSAVSPPGMSMSTIVGQLVSLLVRRIRVSDRDSLIPPLVQCVSALGAHIHYPDQISDIIEEISLRIAEVDPEEKGRLEVLRVLALCMTNVLRVVHAADDREAPSSLLASMSADKGKGPQIDTPLEPLQRRSHSRRKPVSPQVWQETLPLLCEASYAVRSAYARALIVFLQRELPREEGTGTSGNVSTTRFCNALHAALYTLAMSACLGTGGADEDDSPEMSIRASPARTPVPPLPEANGDNERSETTKGVSFNLVEPTPSGTPDTSTPPNGTHTPTKGKRSSRRVSLPLNRLNSSTFTPLASFDNVATPLDFAYIVKILDTLHSVVPATALLTGGPMLFALDATAGTELVRRPGDGRAGAWVLERKRGVREAVGTVWRGVGGKWGVGAVEDLADRALSALPEPNVIPTLYAPNDSDELPAPDDPLSFTPHTAEGESSSATQPMLDPRVITAALATSPMIQMTIHGDSAAVIRHLSANWSVETALRNSFEGYAPDQPDLHIDTAFTSSHAPFTAQSNLSYRSFRPVDVTDLREALAGGQGQAGASGAASFVSTVGTGGRSFVGEGTPRAANGYGHVHGGSVGLGRKEDVREVLKDIFRDKKKKAKEAPAVTVGAAA